MTTKPTKKTRADLERKILELEAQLASTLFYASTGITKAGTSHLMASGALIQVTALGGREIIPPVVIRDGLSDETIEALKKDFARSYDLATLAKPKGAK